MLKTKGIVQPIILAILLGMGFTLIWGFLGLWIDQNVARSRQDSEDWQRLHLQLDGTPVIQTPRGFHDQAGNAIDTSDSQKWLVGSELDAGAHRIGYAPTAPWDERLRAFADSNPPSAVWYFIS